MRRMLVRHSSKAQVLGALSLMFLCTLAFVGVDIATSSGVDVAVDDGTSLGGGTSLSTSTPSGTLTAGPSPCQTEQDALATARTNLINAQTALNQARNDFYAVRGSYGEDTPEYLSAAASLQTANQQLVAAIQAVVTAVENVRSCHSKI